MPRVNPEILKWARETAGLDLGAAAEKIDLGSARGISGPERLKALEAGLEEPSRPLLLRMAKQYRRPLLAFYLAAPPQKGNRGQDFRTLPEGSTPQQEATLDVLLRDISARQSLIRSALEDEEERQPLRWVGSARIENGVQVLVDIIRESLSFDIGEFRAAANPDEAFRILRDRVESTGAFVVLASNLGSHHTSLGVDVFRGLAIADPVAPFIVVNDQDSRTAWSFTLLHEYAHLWLGSTGISGGTFDRAIERFCNEVASNLLLPANDLRDFRVEADWNVEQLQDAIGRFAGTLRVSRTMLAYRLFQAGAISEGQWRTVTRAFRRSWIEQRERLRELNRDSDGGPNYYVVRRHRVGPALLETTARLLAAGSLSPVKAGQVLGVRPNNVQTMIFERPVRRERA